MNEFKTIWSYHRVIYVISNEIVQSVTDLGFLNSLWWDEDLGESIHGSLDWIALNPRHRVQDLFCQPGLVSQGIQDGALLLRNNRMLCIKLNMLGRYKALTTKAREEKHKHCFLERRWSDF